MTIVNRWCYLYAIFVYLKVIATKINNCEIREIPFSIDRMFELDRKNKTMLIYEYNSNFFLIKIDEGQNLYTPLSKTVFSYMSVFRSKTL